MISVITVIMGIVAFILTQHRVGKINTKDSTAEIERIKSDMRHHLERFAKEEQNIDDNRMAIERITVSSGEIRRRLDSIDALKIDATLAGIKTDLKHIRTLLEKNRP